MLVTIFYHVSGFCKELKKDGNHLKLGDIKNKLMDIGDKMLLRKRGIVDSVIGLLKSSYSLEHTRHRSPVNFLASIFSALAAYSFKENKPSIAGEISLLSFFFRSNSR